MIVARRDEWLRVELERQIRPKGHVEPRSQVEDVLPHFREHILPAERRRRRRIARRLYVLELAVRRVHPRLNGDRRRLRRPKIDRREPSTSPSTNLIPR